MDGDIFEGIEIAVGSKFASFIDIIYTDNNVFKNCFINRRAAKELKSLSKKKDF